MKLNTIIEIETGEHEGKIGTICWNHLDGSGGVWGEHNFEMPEGGFGDNLPAPEFMLREKKVEKLLRNGTHNNDVECVGEYNYKIIKEAE